MKCTIRELKETVREVYHEQKVKKTKTLIENILSEKDSMFDRIGNALGRVNPSKEVDDPKKAKSKINKAFQDTEKKAQSFQKDALADTKRVNDYHDAVKDLLDKVTALGDSLGPDAEAESEKKMLSAVKTFYSSLRQAADRLETYMKTVSNDVEEKGLDRSIPYRNTSGLKGKNKPSPDIEEPTLDALDMGDKELERMLGTKPTWKREKEVPDVDVDNPEDVKKFLRGKKR